MKVHHADQSAASAGAVVVMGVAGSGKSAVARALAERLGVVFEEGDDLHPAGNVAKMRAGIPLDDADREPWLDAVAAWIVQATEQGHGGVVSCSALRRRYRHRLRVAGAASLRMVLLDPAEPVLRARLEHRGEHFMPASLLASQLATLERPTPDEHVLTLGDDIGVASLVTAITEWLRTDMVLAFR